MEKIKVAVLSANLGNFDTLVENVKQELPSNVEVVFHTFTDVDFPPMTVAMAPRMQYRIPKLFGWQMFPGYDYYIWLDGSMSLQNPQSVKWFLGQCRGDIALFRHPWRKTVKEEVDHIEQKLQQNHKYMVPRYKNGLHKEQYAECLADPKFKDKNLYTSTAFIYKNNKKVREMLKEWWYYSSRYFTCDQVALAYVVHKHELKINVIEENQYNIPYMTLTSKHK